MIALLTGGAGVVGKALCRELIARGVCVRVLTLPGDSLAKSLPSEVDVRYGDVTDFDSIRDAFENVDVVYHLAAILLSTKRGAFEHVNTDGTRNVLEASKLAGVRRFLYVSSISVTYPILTPYGESKKKGEALVHASGLDWTIVRPTLVIGDGGGVEFNMFRDYVKRGSQCGPGQGNCCCWAYEKRGGEDLRPCGFNDHDDGGDGEARIDGCRDASPDGPASVVGIEAPCRPEKLDWRQARVCRAGFSGIFVRCCPVH